MKSVFRNAEGVPKCSALRVGILCSGLMVCSAVHAQVVTQNLTALGAPVHDDTIDAYQNDFLQRIAAGGLQFGTWSVYGQASQGGGYTNNADRLSDGKASAQLETHATVGGRLERNTGRVDLGMSVDALYFPQRTIQNRNNWNAALEGYRFVGRNRVSFSYQHQHLTQMPTDLGVNAVNRPIPYTNDMIDLNILIPTHGRLSFVPDVRATVFNFANIAGSNENLKMGYRDRVVLSQAGALRYTLSGENALLAVLQGTEIRYTNSSFGLPSLNSDGVAGLFGFEYALPGPFTARVLGGWQYRHYVSPVYRANSTFYAEVQGQWTPTHLTRVSFDLARGIADSAFENMVSFIYTTASIQVRHQYAPNLVLGAGFTAQHGTGSQTPAIFVGTPLFQQQSSQFNSGVNVNVDWIIDRHFSFGFRNDFSNVNSVGSGRYNIDLAMITVHYAL